MVLDRAGNVYVAGSSRGPGHSRGLLLKISPKGKVLWKYILDSGIGTEFHDIGRDGLGTST